MHTNRRRSSPWTSGLAALALAAPGFAQSAEPWSPAEPPLPPPLALESYPTPLLFAGSASLVDPAASWSGAGSAAEWLALGAFPAPAERGAVRRAELDDAPAVAFDALPGGIVLGLVARPEVALVAPRLRETGGRLEVVDGEAVYPLPREDARFLHACLSFATSGRGDDGAVDIRADGTVVLAPEFVDTRTGSALVRCDRVPHARRPHAVATKSVILDRDARLRLDAASGELRPEAELEVRFCRAAAGSAAAWVEAWPATGSVRAELADAAHVAAWVAFFRWVHAVDPAGVARVAPVLARSELELGAARTPRRLEPRAWHPSATPYGAPAAVDDWMWVHRARVLEQR